LFYARGRGQVHAQAGVTTEVLDTMQITRQGTSRICDFAFRLAQRRVEQKGRAGSVTSVDKANVFASMAFWREVFNDTARRYPAIAADSAYVDAMALNLVLKP